VLAELLAWIARGGALNGALEVSDLEKQLAFAELQGIEHIPIKGIDAWLLPHLEAAIAGGDLPQNTLLPLLMNALLAVLFGVPLTLLAVDPARIAPVYRQQLALLVAGTRAAAGAR
jgi:hypothetical protein